MTHQTKLLDMGAVTAYGIALQQGFVGTIQEWLDSLHARIGENGNWWVGETDTGVLADPAKLRELTELAALAAKEAAEKNDSAALHKLSALEAKNEAVKSAVSAKKSEEESGLYAISASKSQLAAEASASAADTSEKLAAESEQKAYTAAAAAEALAYLLDARYGKKYSMSWGVNADCYPTLTFQEVVE